MLLKCSVVMVHIFLFLAVFSCVVNFYITTSAQERKELPGIDFTFGVRDLEFIGLLLILMDGDVETEDSSQWNISLPSESLVLSKLTSLEVAPMLSHF